MCQIYVVVFLLSTLILSGIACDSFLCDFLSFNQQNNLSTRVLTKTCATHCQQLSEAMQLREIWALKVEDSSGRKPTGFLYGNNYYLGSKFMCESLNNPPDIYVAPYEHRLMDLSTLEVKSAFPVEYRMIYLNHTSKLQFIVEQFFHSLRTIHLGLCLPKSCEDSDLEILSNRFIAKTFSNQGDVYGEMKFINSKRLALRPDFMNDSLVILTM